MAINQLVNAHEVGRTFAEIVREDPSAVSVWARKHRDVFEIWLLTAPIDDDDHELALYAAAGTLHEVFPHAFIHFHLINPLDYELDSEEELLNEMLPPNVDMIPVRQ